MVVKNECWTLDWHHGFDGGTLGDGLNLGTYNGRLFIKTHPTSSDRSFWLSFVMPTDLIHGDRPLRAIEGLLHLETGPGAQIDHLGYEHVTEAGQTKTLVEATSELPIVSPVASIFRFPIGGTEFGELVLSTVMVEMKVSLLAAFPAEDRRVQVIGVGLTTTYDQP